MIVQRHNSPCRSLARGLANVFALLSICTALLPSGALGQSAQMLDGEIWLDVGNVYWSEFQVSSVAGYNIWDHNRDFAPKPNSYEGGTQPDWGMFNFRPLPGNCNAGACFSYGNYKLTVRWKRYSYSSVQSRAFYIDYLDATINEDYDYQQQMCGIDIWLELNPASSQVLRLNHRSYPSCSYIQTNIYGGEEYTIWGLVGPDSYAPNSEHHFNIPLLFTTSCSGSTCTPNSIYRINGAPPPQDPCPASGCSITMLSESTASMQAYSNSGEQLFTQWRLPDGSTTSTNPFYSHLFPSLYAASPIPLVYKAEYALLPPAPPTNLTVTGNVGGHPHLSWSASAGATAYDVYRCAHYQSNCTPNVLIGTTSNVYFDDLELVIGNGCGWQGDLITMYHVRAKNSGGTSNPSNPSGTCTDPTKTSHIASNVDPDAFRVHDNYPNPFNPTTEIAFDLPEPMEVQLSIYDIAGRIVDRLIASPLEAGVYQSTWDATDQPSGIYVYRLIAGPHHVTRRMVLAK